MSASRLVALTKPNGKVRPIAVGESLYRILPGLVFARFSEKAQKFLNPFQYGIRTIDGATVAALSSDLFSIQQQLTVFLIWISRMRLIQSNVQLSILKFSKLFLNFNPFSEFFMVLPQILFTILSLCLLNQESSKEIHWGPSFLLGH
ncbi:hypothetical protein GEMRC1_010298 [Eukaryota sp. GEM-RC1]